MQIFCMKKTEHDFRIKIKITENLFLVYLNFVTAGIFVMTQLD